MTLRKRPNRTWRDTGRAVSISAAAVGALLLVSSCGADDPEVNEPPVGAPEEPAEDTSQEPTAEPPVEDPAEDTATEEPPQEDPAEDTTTEEPTEEPAPEEPTEDPEGSPEDPEGPPDEGAGDPATAGLEQVQSYVGLVEDGDYEGAYQMLSPEALNYYPDVSVFEETGVPNLADELADAAGEPQWAIRSAYEETHDSAQVVSLWGEGSDGEPFAFAFAVRKLDGMSWVIDQEVDPSVADDWANWLNPGTQQGLDPWVVNPEQPITFALLKERGPVTAVTASIDDGDEVSQVLNVRPTDGAEMYDLSDSDIGDEVHVVTASWVGDDDPFVHTSATPATTG